MASEVDNSSEQTEVGSPDVLVDVSSERQLGEPPPYQPFDETASHQKKKNSFLMLSGISIVVGLLITQLGFTVTAGHQDNWIARGGFGIWTGTLHNFRKLRNSLWRSALSQNAKRILCKGTAPPRFILWKHLQEAFEWDQSKISLKRYQKPTPANFELNPASLMRNHLANDVLNNEILYLMRIVLSSLLGFATVLNYKSTTLETCQPILVLLSIISSVVSCVCFFVELPNEGYQEGVLYSFSFTLCGIEILLAFTIYRRHLNRHFCDVLNSCYGSIENALQNVGSYLTSLMPESLSHENNDHGRNNSRYTRLPDDGGQRWVSQTLPPGPNWAEPQTFMVPEGYYLAQITPEMTASGQRPEDQPTENAATLNVVPNTGFLDSATLLGRT